MSAKSSVPRSLQSALSVEIAADDTQWVHIMPAGTSFSRDGRGPFRLTDPASVLAETQRYHGSTKMLVDYEHQSIYSVQNGKPVPAAGWIVGLRSEADGIWAKVEWTATAAAAIRNKVFRYLSPVFNHDDTGKVMCIINVAVTNSPALNMTALAAVDFSMNLETVLAELRTLLALDPSADFAAIRAAIEQLQTGVTAASAAPDPSRYVPIGEYTRAVKEANALRQGVTEKAAVDHVNEQVRTGRLAPFMKNWAVELCTANKPAFDRFLEETGPAFNAIVAPSGLRGYAPAVSQAENDLSSFEQSVCSTLGLTPEQFKKARA